MRVHTLLIYLLLLAVFTLSSARAEYFQEQPNLQAQHFEAASALTLTSALNLALEANPEISVAKRELEATQGSVVQAGARPNPSVFAMVQDTRSSTRQTTLQFNQPIELGGKRDSRIKAATLGYDLAGSEIKLKNIEVTAAVSLAFYEVLIAQERVKLAESSLVLAQRAKEAASKRVLAGKISPIEETKSKVAESSAKIELNHATGLLNSARKRLTAFWGNPNPIFESALGDLDHLSLLPPVDQLIGAIKSSPAMQRSSLEVNRRKALVEVEYSKRTPDITISAGNLRNEELGLNQALLGVTVPIPIFDSNQGNIQQAVSLAEKAKDEQSATEIQLTNRVAQSYERWRTNNSAVESFKTEILPSAQSAYDAVTKGFELGKFNFLDVLDAQRTLFQAKSQYLNALLETYQAIAEIERVVGHAAISPADNPKEYYK
jgi:outer membrane protein, heavy metal efflux system